MTSWHHLLYVWWRLDTTNYDKLRNHYPSHEPVVFVLPVFCTLQVLHRITLHQDSCRLKRHCVATCRVTYNELHTIAAHLCPTNKALWRPDLHYVSSLSGLFHRANQPRRCLPNDALVLVHLRTSLSLPQVPFCLLCISGTTQLPTSASSVLFVSFSSSFHLYGQFSLQEPNYFIPIFTFWSPISPAMCPFIFSLTPALSGSRRASSSAISPAWAPRDHNLQQRRWVWTDQRPNMLPVCPRHRSQALLAMKRYWRLRLITTDWLLHHEYNTYTVT